jgi:outer membrane protein OmpA-like peptidoglycan-associated protein
MTLDKTLRQPRLLAMPVLAFLFIAACATVTPVELTDARTAYGRASAGPAAQYTPVDLHKAKVALDKAEACFAAEKNSQKTIDLAYVAERTAQIAEATAQIAISTERTATAGKALGDEQGQIMKDTKGALAKSRADLATSERGQADQVRKTDVERAGREDAETKAAASEVKAAASEQRAAASDQRVKEANDALAKLAAKDDARGLVITLSGGVLFRSNESTLLPAAQTRLNEVADALVARGSNVIVEGYTDSKGSLASNLGLSQRRAESVRGYLVSRGFPEGKIQARGLGPDRPIAENTSSEGRANNRRVEIVIDKSATPTAPTAPATTSTTSTSSTTRTN